MVTQREGRCVPAPSQPSPKTLITPTLFSRPLATPLPGRRGRKARKDDKDSKDKKDEGDQQDGSNRVPLSRGGGLGGGGRGDRGEGPRAGARQAGRRGPG